MVTMCFHILMSHYMNERFQHLNPPAPTRLLTQVEVIELEERILRDAGRWNRRMEEQKQKWLERNKS